MSLFRISPLIHAALVVGFMAQLWATPSERLPQLLEELDHAGLVQDTDRVKSLISEWKQLEPKAAAPWLKEVALTQMSGPMNREAEVEILRRAVKALPANKTLRARLAGLCANANRPQESLAHYRWLFEHATDDLEKFSWALQMGAYELQEFARPWFTWQCLQHPKELLWPVCAAEVSIDGNWVERGRDLNSGNELVQLLRARQAQRMWAIGEATEMLQLLAKDHPSPQNKLQLARAYVYSGQHEAALEILDELARKSNLRNIEVDATAALYFEECLWEKAAAFLGPWCEKEPENYRYRFLLGCAQEEARNLSAAGASFVKLLSIRRDIVPYDPPLPAIYPIEFDGGGRHPFAPVGWRWDNGAPAFPAEAMRVRWFIGTSDVWNAYGYVRREDGDYSYVYHDLVSRYHGNGLMIPSSLEEAWAFAFPHLSALWCEQPPAERKSLEDELWKIGFPAKALLRTAAPGRTEAEFDIFPNAIWECDPMTAEGKAATLAFLSPGATWEAYREASRVFEKSRPDLAARAIMHLGADPLSRAQYEKTVATNPPWPQLVPLRDFQHPKPTKESIQAFPEIPANLKKLVPAEWLQPTDSQYSRPPITDGFARGEISADYWAAFHRSVVDLVRGSGVSTPPIPSPAEEPKDYALLKKRISQMTTPTPRAVVEKYHAYLTIGAPLEAASVYTDALAVRPGDRTLLACAMQSLNAREGNAELYQKWGFAPFQNRPQLYNIVLPEHQREAHLAKVVEYLQTLPDWQRDVIRMGWINGLLRDWNDKLPDKRALSRVAIEIPQAANTAFAVIQQGKGLAGATPPPLEEMVPLAETALLASAKIYQWQTIPILRYRPEDDPAGAADTLLHHAMQTHSPAVLDRIIPKLEQSPSPYAIIWGQQMKLTRDLYFCDPTDFPDVIRRILRGDGSAAWVEEVSFIRNLPFDFGKLVESEIPTLPLTWEDRKINPDSQELRLHTAFAFQTERLFQRQGPEAAAAFFAPITARCLGPKESRREHLRNRSHPAVAAWLGYVGSPASEDPQFCRWLLEVFKSEFVAPLKSADVGWAWDELARNRKYHFPMTATFKAYGWLNGPADFDPMPNPSGNGRSQLGQFLLTGRDRNDQLQREEFWNQLNQGAASEFAREILRTYPGWPGENETRAFSKCRQEIEAASVSQQKVLEQLRLEMQQANNGAN